MSREAKPALALTETRLILYGAYYHGLGPGPIR